MLAQPVGHGREVQGGLQEGGGDAEGLGQGQGASGEEDCTLKAENFVIKGYLLPAWELYQLITIMAFEIYHRNIQ